MQPTEVANRHMYEKAKRSLAHPGLRWDPLSGFARVTACLLRDKYLGLLCPHSERVVLPCCFTRSFASSFCCTSSLPALPCGVGAEGGFLHFLPIVQQHLPSFFFCWCTKVRSRDRLPSRRRGEPRPLPATVWCLRSHTASIQLAQCTASSFFASRSGARPTSWRRDEAQVRPHRLLVCALPSYTDAGRLHLFSHRDFPALRVDE
jgi:hypothetical protein